MSRAEEIHRDAAAHYAQWDKVADIVDQFIDMM